MKEKGRKKVRLGPEWAILMRSRYRQKQREVKKYSRKKKHRKKEERNSVLY